MNDNIPETYKTDHAATLKRRVKWVCGIVAVAAASVIVILALSSVKGKEVKEVSAAKTPVKARRNHDGSLEGSINGHKWIDLGLPSGLKWAECNVGATLPEESGDYFAWGETRPKSDYSAVSSLTYKVPYESLLKNGIVDESGTLIKNHDAARTSWGGTWRMPTEEEFSELITSCKWTIASFNDVNGYLVTGPNKKSIFLPAASFRQNMSLDNVGEFGDYWSSSMIKDLSGVACSLGYSSKSFGQRRYARYAGRSVRPVTD